MLSKLLTALVLKKLDEATKEVMGERKLYTPFLAASHWSKISRRQSVMYRWVVPSAVATTCQTLRQFNLLWYIIRRIRKRLF